MKEVNYMKSYYLILMCPPRGYISKMIVLDMLAFDYWHHQDDIIAVLLHHWPYNDYSYTVLNLICNLFAVCVCVQAEKQSDHTINNG